MARQMAIQKLFKLLENKFGNINDLIDPACARVITTDRLTTSALRDLFSHKVVAVRVPKFYAIEEARDLARHFLSLQGRKNWTVSSSRGTPAFLTCYGVRHNDDVSVLGCAFSSLCCIICQGWRALMLRGEVPRRHF